MRKVFARISPLPVDSHTYRQQGATNKDNMDEAKFVAGSCWVRVEFLLSWTDPTVDESYTSYR